MNANKDPKVSVIMNCRNCSRYLREALDSVYQQTFKDYEIIFWDNKSTDNSPNIALEYGEPIRYFQGEKFLPLGWARNLAIEKARGEYIAFLDCDDIWLPEKLEQQIKLLDSNKELGLVYSDNYVIDGKGNIKNKTSFDNLTPMRGNVFNNLLTDNFIPLLTVIVRKEVFSKAGLFNEKYEINEEYDLWLKIAEYYPVDFIRTPLAKYRIHGGNFGKNVEKYINENFQIITYWLDKKPELNTNRDLMNKVKIKKIRMHLRLAQFLFYKHEYRKGIVTLINSVKSVFT